MAVRTFRIGKPGSKVKKHDVTVQFLVGKKRFLSLHPVILGLAGGDQGPFKLGNGLSCQLLTDLIDMRYPKGFSK